MKDPELFDPPIVAMAHSAAIAANSLATIGANLAADHMDRLTSDQWTAEAYAFLLQFSADGKIFQAYQLREAAAGKVPSHPDGDPRAWGAIILAAKRNGVIKALGYARTDHRASHGRQEQQWTRS